MHCLDMRLKLNYRVPRQFCHENKEATKCSITWTQDCCTFRRENKHILRYLKYH